ncbi:MAG: hypothetical protein IPK97_05935 [Ahniella sp.]|nr:hypothetical protein [Ahniella sp.]
MAWDQGQSVGGGFAVAGVQIGSQVNITPSIAASGHPAGVTYGITLNGNQAYHLNAPAFGDLSGSLVTSARPLVVYGGHRCALVPDNTVDFCDTLVEQMQPTPAWGNEFVTMPFAGRSAGDIIRVYAFSDDTTVTLNGNQVASLNAGQFFETSRTTPARIVTSQAATVAQYAKGCRAEGDPNNCLGDPFMLTVPPIDQWVGRIDAMVPELHFSYLHFINIIAPTSAVGRIRIDGQLIAATGFEVIPGTNYSGAILQRAPGLYRLTSPEPMTVSVYGFRDNESYGFTAPMASDGEGTDSNDVVLRYNPDGTRDLQFGTQGMVLIDHTVAFGASTTSFDKAKKAIVDGSGILIGGQSINATSEQSFFASYRIEAGHLFKDGFED